MELFYKHVCAEQYISSPTSIENMWHYINYMASTEDIIDKENDFSIAFSENQINIYPIKNEEINSTAYFVLRDFTINDLQELNGGMDMASVSDENVEIKDIKELYESDDEMVSHPQHYKSEKGIEVIDVIEAFTEGLNGIIATDTGNIIKYACRWNNKGTPVRDLEKLIWYATHLLAKVKEREVTE